MVLTAGYGAIALFLRWSQRDGGLFTERRTLLSWSTIVVAGTLGNGLVFVSALWASGLLADTTWFDALVRFWIGDCVGIIVALPLFWWLQDKGRRTFFGATVLRWETVGYLGLTALTVWIAFVPGASVHFRYFYVLFLPVVWVATRHGLAGASVAIGAIQAGVVVAIFDAGYPTPVVYDLQAVLIAIAITGLLLGATVDERTRLDEELRVSLKLAAAGRMAGAMAHELNQPLTALLAYAASARRAVASPERMADVLDGLEREARRSGEVVRRMRDFFRIGAIELRPLRVDALLAELVEAQRPRAHARGIEIAASLPESPAVLADRLQLEIVMRNLFANAFEALAGIDGPRRLEVSLQAQPDWVAVTVRDSGPGISPQVFPRLFEPLASGSPAGMGMGLVICRSIVEAHGERLWVEPGPGAAVHFTLPARDRPDE